MRPQQGVLAQGLPHSRLVRLGSNMTPSNDGALALGRFHQVRVVHVFEGPHL